MELKYKRKQKDEEDITKGVKAKVNACNGMIIIDLEIAETGERLGFFALDGFYPSQFNRNRYRLVSVWKSLSPSAKTYFKVFKKKEVTE